MEESILIEAQLLETYRTFFELLMKCLLVSAGLLLVAEIVLIGLCCWQTHPSSRKNNETLPTQPANESEAVLNKSVPSEVGTPASPAELSAPSIRSVEEGLGLSLVVATLPASGKPGYLIQQADRCV